VVFW